MPLKLTPYRPEFATAEIGSLSGLIISDFPEAAYHSRPEVSTHDAGKLLQAPALYRHAKDHPEEPTQAMREGSARHVIVLESSRVSERIAVIPKDAPRRPTSAQVNAKKPSEETIAALSWWADFNRDSEGKIILDAETALAMRDQATAIYADPDASALLSEPIATECAMFWRDPETSVPRRGRPDRLRRGNIVVDLKSTTCAAAESFSRDAMKFGYYRQAADYLDALELLTGEPWKFYWIAAENDAPYLCPCYQCPPEGVDLGRRDRKRALEAWSTGTALNHWPGYQTGPHFLLPPAWATKDL